LVLVWVKRQKGPDDCPTPFDEIEWQRILSRRLELELGAQALAGLDVIPGAEIDGLEQCAAFGHRIEIADLCPTAGMG